MGAIAYQVQVSSNDTFTALKYEELAPEQSGETHVTPSSPLPGSAKFYWRARATDGSQHRPVVGHGILHHAG